MAVCDTNETTTVDAIKHLCDGGAARALLPTPFSEQSAYDRLEQRPETPTEGHLTPTLTLPSPVDYCLRREVFVKTIQFFETRT